MRELFIKWFYKHKAVIIKVVDEAGRLTTHWAIPEKDGTVKLIGVEKAVVLTKESMMISTKRNIPTFLVNYANCETIDIRDIDKHIYDANEFRLILDNDMAEKVFKASTNKSISDEGKIIILVVVICVMGMGYFLNTKITEIKTLVTPEPAIVEVVNNGE